MRAAWALDLVSAICDTGVGVQVSKVQSSCELWNCAISRSSLSYCVTTAIFGLTIGLPTTRWQQMSMDARKRS